MQCPPKNEADSLYIAYGGPLPCCVTVDVLNLACNQKKEPETKPRLRSPDSDSGSFEVALLREPDT